MVSLLKGALTGLTATLVATACACSGHNVAGIIQAAKFQAKVQLILVCGVAIFIITRTIIHASKPGYALCALLLVASNPYLTISASKGDCGDTLVQFSLGYLVAALVLVLAQHIGIARKLARTEDDPSHEEC